MLAKTKPLTSGRISPREVLDAYETTGLAPATLVFVEEGRACALGAMAAVHEPRVMEMHGDAEIVAFSMLRGRVERSGAYMGGFAQAFDGGELALGCGRPESDAAYRLGYRDGGRARRFVFAEESG